VDTHRTYSITLLFSELPSTSVAAGALEGVLAGCDQKARQIIAALHHAGDTNTLLAVRGQEVQ
jgi:hypothetical protein